MPDDALTSTATPAWRRQASLAIGDYAVRPASNEIAGPAGVRRLRPRLMHVLLRLAASPGEVVSRQTLLDDVWPRRAVADEVLSRTIAELRVALADDAREARYIETIPKVGYRLIAPVNRDAIVPAAAPATPAAVAPTIASTKAGASGTVSIPRATALRRRGIQYGIAFAAVVAIAGIVSYNAMRRPAHESQTLEQQLATAVPFSSDPAQEFAPRFSPDGTLVVFATGDSDRSRLVVQNVATGARRFIGDGDVFRAGPVFFPDGTRIAYFRRDGDTCAIVERELTSDRERALVDCVRKPFPRFDIAPDGRRLVYGTPEGLRLHDMVRGDSTPLTRPGPGDVADLQPRFSPDGSTVAFFRSVPGGRSLWSVPVGVPAGVRAMGSPSGLSYGLAWLGPQGPILASVDWSGFRALHVFDPATRNSTLAGARGAQFPDVARGGDIVYESAQYQANLHWLDTASPETTRVLWPSTRYSNDPAVAPDGRRIAFTSNRDGIASLFVGTLEGDARRIPVQGDGVFAHLAWAPDGSALYAVRDVVGSKDGTFAVKIDVATGAVQTLAALGNAVTMIYPSADGSTLFAGRRDGDAMRIVRAPIDDLAAATTLALPAVASFRVLGTHLVYAIRPEDGLVACTLPALTCAPLHGAGSLSSVDDFALSDDAVWFGNRQGKFMLRRYDFAAGRVTAEFALAPTAIGRTIAVAPDGKHAVVARQDPPAIDLMLARKGLR
jgi:DNA-binding winged helix-turn-helix (wHTH) protein/Tol biopolymer transport system component